MTGALKAAASISDLNEEDLETVFGGVLQGPSAKGDSYVCQVKDGNIVTGSCTKVD